MPKVSIITPVHCDISQKVDWLDEMIQSVVSQTLTDWELIIIDDKSPLSLDSVIMKYAMNTRLRWFENAENDGPAKTRNTAVALAESECILPLDADDMLADNEALEYMYDAWLIDTTKTVYGNVQLLTPVSNTVFKRDKVIQLAQYSFENAKNLGGTMPVTVMHSKECHYQAGGWKAELDQGREDVEYWIAAGERGFCGLKINTTTLLYRKHEQSRDYKLKFETQTLRAMQDKIKAMHSDVYAGRYPVACCGDSNQQSVPDPIVMSQSVSDTYIKIVTPLEGYDEKDLEWAAYRGPKKARSGSILTRGPANTPNEYPILGYGHVFQIHKSHHKIFSDRQHLGFEMNQPDPREQPEPELVAVAEVVPQIIEMPRPEMSTIISFDHVASQTKEADVQEIRNPAIIIDENDPRTIEQDFIDEIIGRTPEQELATKEAVARVFSPKIAEGMFDHGPKIHNLGLSGILTRTLETNNWTVKLLAETTPQNLSSLPGIGIKRASSIIAKAQELIK